ncbi:uncharacterized protein [Amphiura filiformis]|uniref:uncharacterized protein n=1 Tax=Amphiura filiformis TaxID=82378 RepID=UPI003B212894
MIVDERVMRRSSSMDNVTLIIHNSITTTQGHYDLIPEKSRSWIAALYYAMIFIVGIPGNALIIRVYTQRKFKSSTHVLILGLAVVDITVCVFRPLMLYYRYFADEGFSNARNILGFIEFIAVGLSAFLTSAIAFDRYDAACHPHERIMTRQKASYVIVIGIIFSVLINCLYIVEHYIDINAYISSIKNFIIILLYVLSLLSTTFFYSCVYKVVKKSSSAKTKWKKVLTNQCIRALQAAATAEHERHQNPTLARQNGQSNLIQETPSNDPPTNHLRVNCPLELVRLSSRSRSNETLTTSTPESRSPIQPKKPIPVAIESHSPDHNSDDRQRSSRSDFHLIE